MINVWGKRFERPNVGGVSVRSGKSTPFRKGCDVNGQMARRLRQATQIAKAPTPIAHQFPSLRPGCADKKHSGLSIVQAEILYPLRSQIFGNNYPEFQQKKGQTARYDTSLLTASGEREGGRITSRLVCIPFSR